MSTEDQDVARSELILYRTEDEKTRIQVVHIRGSGFGTLSPDARTLPSEASRHRGGTMTPETRARLLIDGKLESAGWVVQEMRQLAQEIIDHLEAALASFRDVAAALPRSTG